MTNPHPSLYLILAMADACQRKGEVHGAHPLAHIASKVCTLATSIRRLTEHSCNVELTTRQELRREHMRNRADAYLRPYGMMLRNPWGLCFYAVPLSHDGGSESGCIFLA